MPTYTTKDSGKATVLSASKIPVVFSDEDDTESSNQENEDTDISLQDGNTLTICSTY